MYLGAQPRAGQDDRRVRPDVAPGKLDVDERDSNGVRVVSLRGELDLATAPAACVRLDKARRTPRPRIVVDLSGLRFCDSTGLRALLSAAKGSRRWPRLPAFPLQNSLPRSRMIPSEPPT